MQDLPAYKFVFQLRPDEPQDWEVAPQGLMQRTDTQPVAETDTSQSKKTPLRPVAKWFKPAAIALIIINVLGIFLGIALFLEALINQPELGSMAVGTNLIFVLGVLTSRQIFRRRQM